MTEPSDRDSAEIPGLLRTASSWLAQYLRDECGLSEDDASAVVDGLEALAAKGWVVDMKGPPEATEARLVGLVVAHQGVLRRRILDRVPETSRSEVAGYLDALSQAHRDLDRFRL